MVFHSLWFLLFILLVAVTYFLTPKKWQRHVLLFSGLIFYAVNALGYTLVLIAQIFVCYLNARRIAASADRHRKRALIRGVIFHVVVLLFFKYASLYRLTLPLTESIASGLFFEKTFLLPLGISFSVFQMIGYYADIYNKKCKFEENFLQHMLFFSFFPQIISGPINRADELMPQFLAEHRFVYARVVDGMQRFLYGAFKKVVVADGLGILVFGVYKNVRLYKGYTLLLVVVLYAIVIYCDFSGYSEMAQGIATILGFRMRENFNAPYLAVNMAEFWQRWHISLTSWLSDYIFTPLTWSRWFNRIFYRNKEQNPAVLPNLLIVFLISGLWHGSTLSFLIWGLIHGLLRITEELLKRGRRNKKKTSRMRRIMGCVYVFTVSCITHVFFATEDLSDAMYVFRAIFIGITPRLFRDQILDLAYNQISYTNLYFLFYFSTLMIGLALCYFFDRRIDRSIRVHTPQSNALYDLSLKNRWFLYWLMAIITAFYYLMMHTGISGAAQFIYQGY